MERTGGTTCTVQNVGVYVHQFAIQVYSCCASLDMCTYLELESRMSRTIVSLCAWLTQLETIIRRFDP